MMQAGRESSRSRTVAFGEAWRFWLKLGFISFGGPAGQIALMHRELVERRRWLSEERFLHALNYCMLLPGPEAQQLAIYIGWLMHRTAGGIVAGALFVVPSIFLLLALSYVYAAYGSVWWVAGVLAGFKPVVVAIVVEAVLKIGGRALQRQAHFVIAALSFVAIYFFQLPFPLIVFTAALIGLLGTRFLPRVFQAASSTATQAASQSSVTTPSSSGEQSSSGKQSLAETQAESENQTVRSRHSPASASLPLAIDDSAMPPAHTVPDRARMVKILATGLGLWLLPWFGLLWWRGSESLHAREYLFFTQAALVTFGGAYAVLAYVTQAAVNSFGWVSETQAVDGLALAETTPGPLIMVLQFIGFMASWNHPDGMNQTASAIIGGFITTYVTFLPGFIFIFLGAPYIEILRGNRHLTGALSGVTAAVVGVILNLALVFGAAVIFPQQAVTQVDWFAATVSLIAFVALYRFKADVVIVVLLSGIVGVVRAVFLDGV